MALWTLVITGSGNGLKPNWSQVITLTIVKYCQLNQYKERYWKFKLHPWTGSYQNISKSKSTPMVLFHYKDVSLSKEFPLQTTLQPSCPTKMISFTDKTPSLYWRWCSITSMAWCKTAATALLMHWSYQSCKKFISTLVEIPCWESRRSVAQRPAPAWGSESPAALPGWPAAAARSRSKKGQANFK